MLSPYSPVSLPNPPASSFSFISEAIEREMLACGAFRGNGGKGPSRTFLDFSPNLPIDLQIGLYPHSQPISRR